MAIRKEGKEGILGKEKYTLVFAWRFLNARD